MFHLTIETDNAAFEGDERSGEVARILKGVAYRVSSAGMVEGTARDSNGNTVARFAFTDDAPEVFGEPPADDGETYGASTSNARLSGALDALSARIGDKLTASERAALNEACERIGENPDEDGEA